MSPELVVVRGSGNVYRDLEVPDPDVRQLKAILAAEITKVLDREALSVRGAHARTGIAAADFSRIRNADLARFTVDRLVKIINRLGSRVDVRVRVRRVRTVSEGASAREPRWLGGRGGPRGRRRPARRSRVAAMSLAT